MSSDSINRSLYGFVYFLILAAPVLIIGIFLGIRRSWGFIYHYILVFSFRFWTPSSNRRLRKSYSDYLWSPLLFLAIKSRNTALVRHVLNTPDLILHRDNNNDMALHIAVRHFKPEILELIINYTVQTFHGVSMTNNCDLTPFHIAGKKKNEEAIRMLVRVPEFRDYQCVIRKNDPHPRIKMTIPEDRGMTFLNFYVEDECYDSSDDRHVHDDRNYVKPYGDKMIERKAFVKEIREFLDPQLFEIKTTSGRTLDYILSSASHSRDSVEEDVRMEHPSQENSPEHSEKEEFSNKSETDYSSQEASSEEVRIQM